MTAVHQLVPVLTARDGIGGAVRGTRRILLDLGFDSAIYAGVVDPRERGETRPVGRLPTDVSENDVVIYHLSLGSPLTDIWKNLRARRVTMYHNITPAHYFDDVSARVAYDLRAGREQLRDAVQSADLCIAASTYNLAELTELGAKSGVVIPPPVDLSRLNPVPATPQQPPTLLFVGRFAPNKRHDMLLLILKALRETTHPDARLVLAGGLVDAEPYVAALASQATELGIEGAVAIPAAGISDRRLHDYYANAGVFVCASEHEGFCIPLLEAMAFSVPVVALDAGAVAETVGDAAVLMRTMDPLVWAGVVARVLDDTNLRSQLIASGKERVAGFDASNIKQKLSVALGTIGVHA
jgi:glycosyltransferase involved in cell wall biosynthesis